MNKSRVTFSILEILLGIFMSVYGELDDSPGGQLLGLVAIIMGVIGIIKGRRKASN